jgi:hypothetical protein
VNPQRDERQHGLPLISPRSVLTAVAAGARTTWQLCTLFGISDLTGRDPRYGALYNALMLTMRCGWTRWDAEPEHGARFILLATETREPGDGPNPIL